MAIWWLPAVPEVLAQTYDFDEGLEAVTKGLISGHKAILKNKKIAVFGIIESKSGNKWEISSHIEDGIVDVLVNNGYRVIERRRIQDVIKKEIKKVTDLWFDQARVAQFGKLVGADFVVTGRYVLWGQGMLKISIRAINVSDGEIVAADKVKVHTDRIANLLKSEEQKIRPTAVKASTEQPVKIARIDALSHESGKLGKYKALIIGINAYEGPKIPDLETATNDATAVAKVLKEKYGFEVKLLLDREATKEAIYKELRGLTISTKPDDSVLIYFAGHGDLDRTYNGGWWIPTDAVGGNPVTYLDNVQVQKAMRNMKARHVLLVSDSCYSGTLFGKARSLPPVIDDKYYLNLYNEKSRWGMTSGNKTPVSDQGTGGNSVFAYQLIKALEKSDKPFLSTQELYTRIAPVIANNSEQTPICRPIVNTGDQGGEFVFVASVKKEPPLTIPKVHQRTLNKDMLFWQSIKDSHDPSLFDAYLKTFPNGIFAFIAERKIATLEQKERSAPISPAALKPRLFVEIEPKDASVRILNIVPKFYQGMDLDPGRYHTEVSSDGYKTEKMWVKLESGQDATLRFNLERKPVPQVKASIKQTPKHSTPVMPSSKGRILGRDGIYVAYAGGIVKDTNTGLEWKVGPNRNTNWAEARSWVNRLKLGGGGWRMPTQDELKGLYRAGTGSRNMTPLFKTTAWWVWSGKTKNATQAWIFYFSGGYGYWTDRGTSSNLRAFAVRSRGGGVNRPKNTVDKYRRNNRHKDVRPPVQPPTQRRHENDRDIDRNIDHWEAPELDVGA
ncbi:MAG: caspase family protein [Deltaproteobacteria bacterium]|nr:caspase family protein [Deltaproteobacteria bacterium]